MSNFVIVAGASGAGKSTSVKGLNPKETVVINVLNKRLPFKGSAKEYNKENKNLFHVTTWSNVVKLLDNISNNAENVRNIVIDDGIYIMRTEFFDRCDEKGFDKYNALADHFRKIIDKCGSLRDNINVFMMLHTEPIEEDGNRVGYKTSSVGKLLDKMYSPVESVAIVLYCVPKYDANGKPEYGFYTHNIKVGGVEIPAKTPEGMFTDDFIPNDLGEVNKAMDAYYNGED